MFLFREEFFAVADQLLEILVLVSDLSKHPLPGQAKEMLELNPLKSIEKGRITRRFRHLHVQCYGKRLVMALGETLEIPGAAATTEDAHDRHQQQHPLGVAQPTALASFWHGLQKGDQISIGNGIDQGFGTVLTKPEPGLLRQPPCA